MTADKPTPVPRLRFPEFRDAPPWSSSPLESVCEVLNKRRIPITKKDRKAGPFPYYGASGIVDYVDDFMFDERLILVGEDGAKWGPFEQTAFIADGKCWVNNHAHVLRSVSLIDSLLEAHLVRSDLGRYVTGAAPPKLTLGKLKTIPIPIPSSPTEQQKIADCLGSLDDLIAAEDRKLEALRQHKQGLMQQLFPQPGETVPRLRFPEFSDEGAWEETTIGNMGEVITGSTPSTSEREFYGGDFMFVSPADISDLRFVEETKTTLTKAGFAECRPIKKNSVLFVCIGSTIGKVAQCSRPCATNQQINSLVASPAFVADFVYYLLDRESLRVARLAGKQAVPIINKSLFATVKVTAPTRAEQQRIADCLSSLDAGLTTHLQKLNALKTHKQGLMQQLFPSLERH